jgi:hypothetical protein
LQAIELSVNFSAYVRNKTVSYFGNELQCGTFIATDN